STFEDSSAVWWMPRAVLAGRDSCGAMYVSRMRWRSASISSRSTAESVMRAPSSLAPSGRRSDPEEQVEVPVGQIGVASERASVHPTERGQHQAPRVELEHGAKVVEPADLVHEPSGPGL